MPNNFFDDDLLVGTDASDAAASSKTSRTPQPPSADAAVGTADGLDVLSVPSAKASVAGPRRIGSSRLGTLLVLVVTAALVIGGVWLVNRGNSSNAEAQTGGGTIIKLPGTSSVPPPELGKPAQDFTLTTIDGKSVSLAGLKGKPVWVTFGASWCAGCQAEVPDIQAAYSRFSGKGVVVLGINISEEAPIVKAYAARMGLTFPMGADPKSAIADMYAVSAIPSHFFIDSQGVIRDIRVGALAPDTMDSILNKLVAS